VVFQPAVEYQGQSPLTRATQASVTSNMLLLADLRPLEVSRVSSDGSVTVRGRDQNLFTITPDDAAFHQTTVDKLVAQAMQAIRTGFQQEKVGRAY
jgi:ribulose-5-phosphate 4-epimerase/fuculose-1-phosphate aldolase